jgi:hypothetical protein
MAARCSELMGKTLAIFRDCTQLVEPTKQIELDATERAECIALAAIRLGCCLPGDAQLSPVFMPSLQDENQQENGPESTPITPRRGS